MAMASGTAAAILLHGTLRLGGASAEHAAIPLYAALSLGGVPLVYGLARRLARRQFGSDTLAGISIIAAALLGEYLAGTIVVLMMAGGEALEAYAVRSASSVLDALARRTPSKAHRKRGATVVDIAVDDIVVNDTLVVHPHEICPIDGVVVEGHGSMDESYLTGEPFQMTKTRGSNVISGAINGGSVLTIRATARAAESRYAQITEVMRESATKRPRLRRLGDRLGALYTPAALSLAAVTWAGTGDATRFLAVLVIATPCPLLIAIPVAIIGSISRCAQRAIIVRNPVALEQITECRTAIFDKTGTLTYGEPTLTEIYVGTGFTERTVLMLVAGVERYSKHPLARAILSAYGDRQEAPDATEVSEQPGRGLQGTVLGRQVMITSRHKVLADQVPGADDIPASAEGLECAVVVDGRFAGILRFRDAARAESRPFVSHLRPKHGFEHVMIISGDRESEVRYLATQVGIDRIHAQQSPEQKLAIVRAETARAKTLYVGDGINDAPAMLAATVGMAIGHSSDVTSAAAAVVVMDNSLRKVDEFMHISRRMRRIALQSAVGGMALSMAGMCIAAAGYLTPVAGALGQELIDVLAVLNALRAALPPRQAHDL